MMKDLKFKTSKLENVNTLNALVFCFQCSITLLFYSLNLSSEAAQNLSQSRKNEDSELKLARLGKTNINSRNRKT